MKKIISIFALLLFFCISTNAKNLTLNPKLNSKTTINNKKKVVKKPTVDIVWCYLVSSVTSYYTGVDGVTWATTTNTYDCYSSPGLSMSVH